MLRAARLNVRKMAGGAQGGFETAAENMEALKHFKHIERYGESGVFPVYGGRM